MTGNSKNYAEEDYENTMKLFDSKANEIIRKAPLLSGKQAFYYHLLIFFRFIVPEELKLKLVDGENVNWSEINQIVFINGDLHPRFMFGLLKIFFSHFLRFAMFKEHSDSPIYQEVSNFLIGPFEYLKQPKLRQMQLYGWMVFITDFLLIARLKNWIGDDLLDQYTFNFETFDQFRHKILYLENYFSNKDYTFLECCDSWRLFYSKFVLL